MYRKHKAGNKVIRAITVALAAVAAVGQPLTTLAVNNRVEDYSLEREYVDSSKDEFHDQEASNNADANRMSEAAKTAQDAADKATETDSDMKDKLGELDLADKNTVGNEADDVAKKVDDITTDTSADKAVKNAEAAKETVDDYNNQVATDQEKVDDVKIDIVAECTEVNDQSKVASDSADKAKSALEKVQSGSKVDQVVGKTEDGSDKTVGSYVNDTVQAAKAANDAVDVAETEVTKADDKYTATVKEYNKFAMMYGKAIYGAAEGKGYSDEYTDADFMAAGFDLEKDADVIAEIKANLRIDTQKAAIEADNKIDDIKLDALGQQISDAQAQMSEAQGNLAAAKKAADAASHTVNDAFKAVTNDDKTGYADVARENAAIVFDGEAFVAEARKDAEEKAEIKECRTREYQNVVAEKENVCRNADAHIKSEQLVKEDQDKIIAANAKILKDEKTTLEDYAKAKAEIEKANNRKADADGIISGLEEAKKMAEQAVEKAAADLKTATDDYNDAQNKFNEKKAAQDARNAEADEAYEEFKAKAASNIRKDVANVLKAYSDSINQAEYDKALDAWANQQIDYYMNIINQGENWDDANKVIEGIVKTYDKSGLTDIINESMGLQGTEGKSYGQYLTINVINFLREEMPEYEKTLATIDAKFALEQANSAANSISEKKAEVDELKTEIKSAQSTLYKANVGLTNAKKEYEDAVARLNELKDGTTVSEISLDDLLKQIEIAQAEVKSAKENFEKAKVARDEATKCAETALKLMNQYNEANKPSIGASAPEPVVIVIPPANNGETAVAESTSDSSYDVAVASAALIAPAPATDAAQTAAPAAAKATTATRTSSKAKTDSKAKTKETEEIADEKTPLAVEKTEDKKDDAIKAISDEEAPLAAEKNMTLIGVIVAGISFVLAVISVIFLKKKDNKNK